MTKTNNLVAKHARKFNKAVVMKDRKKAQKKGDRKHKGKYEENEVSEEKKGLWANIRAKRARGEAPAKPGDKDYPKTLDIGEGKNTPNDGNPCWDTHKKVGTKMKNGKRVNDCVPKESVESINEKSMPRKEFEKLKKGDKLKFTYDSTMGKKGHEVSLVVTGKSRSAKYNVDTVKMKDASSSGKRAAYYLYSRKGGDATMAHGDMGVVMQKYVKESVEQVEEELSTMQKRKHLNLKKRAKQGNSQAKIRLKKFEKEFASDLDTDKRSAKQSSKGIKGKGAADPHSGQAFTGKGSGAGSDDNLIIQLRKAQDVSGKMDIKVTPSGKTTRLSKQVIDKLLAGYDKMQKPDEKRKFKILLTKQLRKQAK